MNVYKITVREILLVEYSIEADSEEEARKLIDMGDQQYVLQQFVDWDIIDVEERES